MRTTLRSILIFLFLFSCGNQNRSDEYQCIFFDRSGSIYLTVKDKIIKTKMSSSPLLNTYNIKEENSDKIIFGNDNTPIKYHTLSTFYKKSLKLREEWVGEGKTYIHQCEKLN